MAPPGIRQTIHNLTSRGLLSHGQEPYRESNEKSQKQIMIPLGNRGTVAYREEILRAERRIRNPTKEHMNKFADKSFLVYIQQASKFKSFLDRIDQKYPIIFPRSNAMFIWNFLVILSIVFNFYEIPISLLLTERVYDDQFSYPPSIFLNYFFFLVLLVDCFGIKPNLAFFQSGQLVTSRHQIFRKYVRIRFFVDFFSLVILLLYIAGGSHLIVYVKILFYVKAYSLVKCDRAIMDYLELHKVPYALYQFLRVCFFIAFITIWISSVYFAVDYYFYQEKGYYYQNQMLWLNGTSVLDNLDVIQAFSWPFWLAYGVYWVLETAATIGYGDVTPRNPESVLFCNVVILLMTVFFALFINTVWGIISELEESGSNYYQNWQNLKRVFTHSEASQTLRQEVSDYFHELWKANQSSSKEDAKSIHENLSQNLKNELVSLSNIPLFDDIPLFLEMRQTFPEEWRQFKISILPHIQIFRVADNQNIVEGVISESYLYCVDKGIISIALDSTYLGVTETDVKKLQKFGHLQFFLGWKSRYRARAQCYSNLTRLKSALFIKELKKHSNLYNFYVKELLKIQINRNYERLGDKCIFCAKSEAGVQHSSANCPQNSRWRQELEVDKSVRDLNSQYKINKILLKGQAVEAERKKVYRSLFRSIKLKVKPPCKQTQIDQINTQESINVSLSK